MIEQAISTVHYLFNQAEQNGDMSAFSYKSKDQWQEITWNTYKTDVHTAAGSLLSLNCEAGDKVCILGFNCYEWVVMDMAAMMIGAIPAGIYETSSPEEITYILNHSEAKIVLIENQEQWEKIEKIRGDLQYLKTVILMKNCERINDGLTISWDAFMDISSTAKMDTALINMMQCKPDDVATFIYTSGTTGAPKAVMLTNDNLTWTAKQAIDMIGLLPSDTSLSYLPLSHIAEQMFTIHAPTIVGWKVYFATGRLDVLTNLKEVYPSVLFGVPRVWEKFYAGIKEKVDSATGLKAKIMAFAMKKGTEANMARFEGKVSEGFGYNLANKLVFSKVKEAIGFTKLRVAVSGAAPINADILKFFASLDVPIWEVYGQSEGSGPTTFNRPEQTKLGSTGPKYPGTEVKLAEDGEILLKGRNVFKGYYKDQIATDECLTEGWLHSGDLGRFDEDDFLFITGRKKEIIVTSGGKNIAPTAIEEQLKGIPVVSQAVVIGDRRNYITALITLDAGYLLRTKLDVDITGISPTELVNEFQKYDRDYSEFCTDSDVLKEVQDGINNVNDLFARVEHVRKFKILPRDFSIVEDELTPTFKIKRKKVYANWEDSIEKLYAEEV
ncbi:MAG: AMP-binding protein [Candidatus Marinimicrobia bacterium]|jgi:long-chain acyl-CoA synthetase|nr:AMP-binding protein [Candidatus Neomarinimicrobiota bacterium]MBT3496484.1 AMP-binding protein [Candidatus Neomarinimicrobiota bacterium]MBT3692181.1 AMP-binding protein [Candidatus Neomarinimicrobiota bacterium]MBT4177474.1 AMP-binding protein [Candidatus Neomarinimicrobiota bacterium]MBT4592862.1 AMP-binding protein [Candidatus Neomarinimicrobiota bacterium]